MSTNATDRTAHRLRPTAGGGLLVVVASLGLSLLARGPLGAQLRIRWTVGPHYYLGPESVSTPAVLAAFPIVVAALYLGANWLRRRFERTGEFEGELDTFRRYYELAAFATLLAVVVLQGALIAANLYL